MKKNLCPTCKQVTKDYRSTQCRSCSWIGSSVHQLSPVEAAWVGAMVEGEGHIRPPSSRALGLDLGSTDVETISTLLRLVGVGTVYRQVDNQHTRKPLWRWGIHRVADLARLLPQLVPYLTSKQEVALAVLRCDRLVSHA